MSHNQDLGPCPPAARNWKKEEKHGFRPPRKIGRKISRKEMPPKPYFWAIFLFVGLFFPIFWGRPKSVFCLFFFYFGPEARNPRFGRQAWSNSQNAQRCFRRMLKVSRESPSRQRVSRRAQTCFLNCMKHGFVAVRHARDRLGLSPRRAENSFALCELLGGFGEEGGARTRLLKTVFFCPPSS